MPSNDLADPSATPLRVVICGEVASGKSTVLNAFFRDCVVPDNLGNDTRPTVFASYSAEPIITYRGASGDDVQTDRIADSSQISHADKIQIDHGHAHLKPFEFIEVPLTSAEELTQAQIDLIASADVMIWVTIASQAWRLTEKNIVDQLGAMRPKRCILAVSRGDKLLREVDRQKISDRIQRETSHYFEACVFMSGAKRQIKNADESQEAWDRTGAPELLAALDFVIENPDFELAPLEEIETEEADEEDIDFAEIEDAISRDMAAQSKSKPTEEANVKPAIDLISKIQPVVDDLVGDIVFGVYLNDDPHHCEVIRGEPEQCETLGNTCRNLKGSWSNAYQKGQTQGLMETGAMLTNAHSILFSDLPDQGFIFMMSDVASLSHDAAQSKIAEIRKSVITL